MWYLFDTNELNVKQYSIHVKLKRQEGQESKRIEKANEKKDHGIYEEK